MQIFINSGGLEIKSLFGDCSFSVFMKLKGAATQCHTKKLFFQSRIYKLGYRLLALSTLKPRIRKAGHFWLQLHWLLLWPMKNLKGNWLFDGTFPSGMLKDAANNIGREGGRGGWKEREKEEGGGKNIRGRTHGYNQLPLSEQINSLKSLSDNSLRRVPFQWRSVSFSGTLVTKEVVITVCDMGWMQPWFQRGMRTGGCSFNFRCRRNAVEK